jgi:hypothetical protein
VKNRPFYEGPTVEDIELVAGTTTDVSADLCAKLFEHRKTATYIIDGKPASFVRDYDIGIPTVPYWEILVDNGTLCHVFFDGIRGETLSSWYDGHSGEYLPGKISFTVVTDSIHQLDEKFIPDTIARVNDISEAVTTDGEIVDILIQEDMLFAIADSDGSVLVDENNNILTW